MVEKLDIIVEADGTKPVNITVEIDLVLLPEMKGLDAGTLVNDAVKEAVKASETCLRKLK
jgi:hypothetical protein